MLPAFETSGIERRYSVVPIEWFDVPHGWKERTDRYLEGATDLFADAALSALERARWRAEDVDIIVTVSSTGIATPTLEARCKDRLGFREDVTRVPVFGLGCAGGVSGLEIARSMAAARPRARVLLVVVETCTLWFRSHSLGKADVIATVLFSDGAAAVCLSSKEPVANHRRIEIGDGRQSTWPDTLGIMGWNVQDDGLGVIFDRSIPDFVNREFATATDAALTASKLERGDVDRFVCHPGGAKVIAAIERALGLRTGSLEAERDVLREAGNMSAPTVLFVLERVLRDGGSGQLLTCALGPGFTASFVPLRAEPP